MSENYFDPEKEKILIAAVLTSCSLSVLGTFLIILSYILWKDNRSPLRLLLVYLSIADLLTAVGNLVGRFFEQKSHSVCAAQSFVTTFSSMSSFLWTTAIAIYLYLVISKRHVFALKLTFLFHLICWGVPLMIVCLAMGFNALGIDDYSASVGWCWISYEYAIIWPTSHAQIFWKITAGKGIELLTYVLTPIIYILSKRELSFQHYDQRLLLNTNIRSTLQDTDRKLVLIPIIFVGVRLWGSVRLFTLGQQIQSWYWLALMQGIGDSAQGWANCLLYCIFTRKIREKFVELLTNIFCCRCGTKEELENEVT